MRALTLLVLILGCAGRPQPLTPREGYVQVTGGRVWYRVAGTGRGTPLIALHGGPGVPSTYLKPLAALGDDRPVIFYDQLGTGKSDHPGDTSLWHMDRYLAELDQVRRALGLDEVYVYGHSWGTIIATEYALTHPHGLRGVIFGGPVFDAQRYLRDNDSLIGTLPDSISSAIRAGPGAPASPHPRFMPAYIVYLQHFYARRLPWSPELDSAVRGRDPTSDQAMTPYLNQYNRTSRLQEIDVPTLLLVGGYDVTTPASARAFQSRMRGAELVVFDSSGHLPMQDEPERYVAAMREFLRRADRNRR